ncbi:hypothetical protein PAMP_020475 [Pampus punctatissimus]
MQRVFRRTATENICYKRWLFQGGVGGGLCVENACSILSTVRDVSAQFCLHYQLWKLAGELRHCQGLWQQQTVPGSASSCAFSGTIPPHLDLHTAGYEFEMI